MIPLSNVRIKLITNNDGLKQSHTPSKDSSRCRSHHTCTTDEDTNSDNNASQQALCNSDPSSLTTSAPVICDRSPLAGRYLKSCFATKPRQFNLSVAFSKVEFREYPIILVENPCTSSGPPIGIDWTYDPEDTKESDIDSYESFVIDNRRSKSDLRIPADVRVEILTNAGYSPNQLRMAVKTLKVDKDRMHASIRNRKYDAINERAEMFKNGFRRMSSARRGSVSSSLGMALKQRASEVSSAEPSTLRMVAPRRASTGSSIKPLGIKRDSLAIPW